MKFMNDWIGIALALAAICGGLLAGRKFGVVAAWWLAGGAWLAFRLADRMWKPAVLEMRAGSPDMEMATWLPIIYAMLFAALFIPTVIWIAVVRPKAEFDLPTKSEVGLSYAGGLVAGVILFLATVQSHVLHPVARESMPRTMEWAGAVLIGLGQEHVAPAATPPPPAKPLRPQPAESGR